MIDAWGDPVGGVQLGLAVSDRPPQRPGELPTLDMRLRNISDREVTYIPFVMGPKATAIEIDGAWYSPRPYVAGNEREEHLAPGAETGNIPFEVSVFDMDGDYVPLDKLIKPGKHSLRVNVIGGVYRSADAMSLFSNSIALDVAPGR
jgi:hypothetical protein